VPLLDLRYFSDALGKQTAGWAILPPRPDGRLDVLFLLHGLSDDHTMWGRRTSIERYVEGRNLLVVMPNGERGFYVDGVEGAAYGTAVGRELPELIRGWFPVRASGWWAQGLSMGGYGAWRTALANPDTFSAAWSHSGALDFGDGKWRHEAAEFHRILGPSPQGGPADLRALIEKDAGRTRLGFDCGSEDFLIDQNRAMRDWLTATGRDHLYAEHPGAHDWIYWDLHVREGLEWLSGR
jgi:putative tributyrin esterase